MQEKVGLTGCTSRHSSLQMTCCISALVSLARTQHECRPREQSWSSRQLYSALSQTRLDWTLFGLASDVMISRTTNSCTSEPKCDTSVPRVIHAVVSCRSCLAWSWYAVHSTSCVSDTPRIAQHLNRAKTTLGIKSYWASPATRSISLRETHFKLHRTLNKHIHSPGKKNSWLVNNVQCDKCTTVCKN